jgi:MFS family permease
MAEMAIEGGAAQSAQNAAEQGWPSARLGYLALAIIIYATFLNFFDAAAFGLLVEDIKKDFGLSNTAMGLLGGPVNVAFFVIVMLPLSRMADIYPRKYVLAIGALLIAVLNAAGGFAMGFASLALTRMLVGAGGGAHAPGAYSMLADYFPPEKRKWPFALLQIGFIGGGTIGAVIAGRMLGFALTLPETQWQGIAIHGWKYVLLMLALPGVLAFVLFLLLPEPPRRGVIAGGRPLPFRTVFAELWSRRAIYGPLFLALGFSTANALAIPFWTAPLFMRSYGWTPQYYAAHGPLIILAGWVVGMFLSPLLLGFLGRFHRAANVRAVTLCLVISTPFAIIAPMMSNPWLALVCFTIAGMMGIISSVPQNLTIQEITPNQMRGQVTGLYLMMFTAVGAAGPFLGGFLTDHLFGHDDDLWKSLALMAAVLMPAAAYTISRAIGPYDEEVKRLEAEGR